MSMTLSQLKSAVKDNIGGRTDKDSVIINGLNFALEEVAKAHPWRSLRNTVLTTINAGDIQLTLPDGLVDITDVTLIFGVMSYPMRLTTKESFLKKFPNVAGYPGSRPILAYMENGVLYFAPKSTATYQIRIDYWSFPTLFALIGTESAKPPMEANLAIVGLATAYVWDSLGMMENSAVWKQSGLSALSSAIRVEKRGLGLDRQAEDFEQDSVGPRGSYWLDPFNKG